MPSRTKREIRQLILAAEKENRLYNCADRALVETFRGSLDRYCEVACAIQGFPRVLDVGSGTGLLAAVMSVLGHQVTGVDICVDPSNPGETYRRHQIEYQNCNVEVDRFPFADAQFDAVTCGQTLEHFTGSHLPAMREAFRVLKPGGLLEVDVPNVASFRNRLRLLRGKNITWEYRGSYLLAEPILYKGHSFYPNRHNREFTRDELQLLLQETGLKDVRAWHFSDLNHRVGFDRVKDFGSWLRNRVPGWRKSIMAVGRKPQ